MKEILKIFQIIKELLLLNLINKRKHTEEKKKRPNIDITTRMFHVLNVSKFIVHQSNNSVKVGKIKLIVDYQPNQIRFRSANTNKLLSIIRSE